MNNYRQFRVCISLALIIALTLPSAVLASHGVPGSNPKPTDEVPSTHYDSMLYSEIYPRLQEIERSSKRVRVDIIGQSAGGRDLYLVTISDPETMGRLGHYMALRKIMLEDPEKALEMIDQFDTFKVPIFINGSIHGNEYNGSDAAMRLIETLAFDNSPETLEILANTILLINVVHNPDGRVLGTRANANGFDLNRDFITQSQPETRTVAKLIAEWNPMVLLDLHGYYYPMLIEPCTPLHNPNYEYDLFIKWALDEALAMEAELLAQTGFKAQIPFLDDADGWDDYGPNYTPMYAMYHGAYGHTLETAYQDERGVDAHYWAVWGALKFASRNRVEMIRDQIEIFRRGFLDLPQMLIPDEILDLTKFDQFNELTLQEFPAAYIIPASAPGQVSPHQAARLVDFLIDNDVQVHSALQSFAFEGTVYPAGTYIVWMDQPKRGLANTILDAGRDLSALEGLTFYSPPAAWSNPLLWGAARVIMPDRIEIATVRIDQAVLPVGSIEAGDSGYYAFLPNSLAAFQAANEILKGGNLYRAPEKFDDNARSFDAGTFILPVDAATARSLADHYALDLFSLQKIPETAIELSQPRIAVVGDEGTLHALKVLGFSADVFSASDMNSTKILQYDILINQNFYWSNLGSTGQQAFEFFFANGGDYLGLLSSGTQFAIDAGVLDVSIARTSGNGIVSIEFDPQDNLASGFFPVDYAFAYNPVWFTRLGSNVTSTARLAQDDFFISGYWPGWQDSGATGYPVIVHTVEGESDIYAFGIDTTFRAHPENTFRLLGAAIFDSQD